MRKRKKPGRYLVSSSAVSNEIEIEKSKQPFSNQRPIEAAMSFDVAVSKLPIMQRSFPSSSLSHDERISFQFFSKNIIDFLVFSSIFFPCFLLFPIRLLLLRRLISFIDFFFLLFFAVRLSLSTQLAHSPFPLRRLISFIASNDNSLPIPQSVFFGTENHCMRRE